MFFTLVCFFVSASILWTPPETDALRAELAPFLQKGEVWPADSSFGTAPFDDVINILRRSSEPIRYYLNRCDEIAWQELPFAQPLVLPQAPLHIHSGDAPTKYLLGSLRYYLAQRLVQARLFDEAKQVLEELTPENCIDPAGVLMTKAVVFHHFSEREAGLAALKDFQKVAEQKSVPRRYTELAKILQFNWEKQSKEDDPEKISSQMDNVRRRLEKGRPDDDTQEAEKDILNSLEKLIKKIEEQAMKKKQSNGGQGNSPAEESRLLKQKGPGNVDRQEFSSGDHWGDLPAKDREEALLKIEKEFPAYYRDIIEQYFREMAK